MSEPKFNWNEYETKEAATHNDFDWNQYETKQLLKATDADKQQAIEQIKKHFPGMPEGLIHALLPEAVRLAENPEASVFHLPNPTGAAGAYFRGLRKAPLQAAENLASLIGLPVDRNATFPRGIELQEEDLQHPIASLGGNLAGNIALGGGLAKAANTAIPAITQFAQSGLLPFLTTAGAEGSLLGAGISNPGERLEGGVAGGLLGLGTGALAKLIGSIPGAYKWYQDYGNTSGLKENASKAEQNLRALETPHEANELSYESLKNQLERNPDIGTSNPNTLYRNVEKLKQEQRNLEQSRAALPNEEELIDEELRPLNEISEIDDLTEHHENLLASNKQRQADIEENFSKDYLGRGQEHRVRLAKRLNPILEARQNEIGQGYKALENDLASQDITLPSRPVQEIVSDITKKVQGGELASPEVDKLKQELDLATNTKSGVVPASNFVATFRSLRQEANNLRHRAYGKDPKEFARMTQQAKDLDVDVKKMETIINNNLGDQYLNDLQALNKRYSTEVAPLFNDPFFHAIQKGKAPANMMEALMVEPHIKASNPNKITGKKILNDIIAEDPELTRLVLGEKYAENPKALHEWSEAAFPHAQRSPEVNEFINQHQEAQQHVHQAERNLNVEKSKIQNAKKERARLKEENTSLKTKNAQINKENEANIKAREQIKVHEDEYKQISKRIPLLEKAAKQAEAALIMRGLSGKSLREAQSAHRQAIDALKKANDERGRIMWKLFKMAAKGAAIGGTGIGVYKYGNR